MTMRSKNCGIVVFRCATRSRLEELCTVNEILSPYKKCTLSNYCASNLCELGRLRTTLLTSPSQRHNFNMHDWCRPPLSAEMDHVMDMVRIQQDANHGLAWDPLAKALISWDNVRLPPLISVHLGKLVPRVKESAAQAIIDSLAEKCDVPSIVVRRAEKSPTADGLDLFGSYRIAENEIWFYAEKVLETVLVHEFAHYWCTRAFSWPTAVLDWDGTISMPIKPHGPVFARALFELYEKCYGIDWRLLKRDVDNSPDTFNINEGENESLHAEWTRYSFLIPVEEEVEALKTIGSLDHANYDYSNRRVSKLHNSSS
jgi:hypothetical protein